LAQAYRFESARPATSPRAALSARPRRPHPPAPLARVVASMSDRARNWQQSFQKSRAVAAQVQTELQRWELLGSANPSERSDRTKLGSVIRAKVNGLKIDLEKLERELEALSKSNSEHEVTRKSITQFRDDLAQAVDELSELQQRAKGALVSSRSTSPGSSFARPASDSFNSSAGGVDLQPVSNRALLEQQRQTMKDLEAPGGHLDQVDSTVDNLQQVARMISREITDQNLMLDQTNDSTDRVAGRLTRVRELMNRVSRQQSNRILGCTVALMVVVLIFVFLKVLLP